MSGLRFRRFLFLAIVFANLANQPNSGRDEPVRSTHLYNSDF